MENEKFFLMYPLTKSMHQYGLGSDCLENSSAEKDLGVLEGRLNINQQHALAANGNKSILSCIAGRLREVTLPIYSTLVGFIWSAGSGV